MKCPRCVHRIHRGAEICPHCGFSMEIADQQFGSEPWRMRRLTDSAGVLRSEDREQVQLAMGRFSRRFPQLFAAVYTGKPGPPDVLRSFGFWLLNRSAFDDVPMDMPNEAGILLVIDPENRTACMTYGYLLEGHLNEQNTFDCLARAHGHWLEGRYVDGIVRVLAQLEKVLISSSRRARRRLRRMPDTMGSSPMGDVVKPLREGHRPVQVDKEGEA